MGELVVSPFSERAFERIEARPGDKIGFDTTLLAARGSACIVWHGEEPIAAIGVVDEPDGKWAWARISDEANGLGIRLTRLARELMDGYMRRHDVDRLQVWVRRDRPMYRRWIRIVGFRLSGLDTERRGVVHYEYRG